MNKPGPKPKQMKGVRFGRLVVVDIEESIKGHGAHWRCLCDCGAQKTVRGDALRRGVTVSCGCRRAETLDTGRFVHGKARTRLYRIWGGMMQRCHNPNNGGYPLYGGRGIVVCESWRQFANFARDMGPSFSPGLTLEREDNERGYEPGNVRWAAPEEQSLNTRRSRRVITPLGEHSLKDAALIWGREEALKFPKAPRA